MMRKNNQNKMSIVILTPLMALIAPFLVWIIEIYLPYPYLIEEFIKLILILNLKSISSVRKRIILGLILGLMFSLSENVFYFMNFITINSPFNFLIRFLLTTILHLLTISLINIFFIFNKKLIILGFSFAVLIHYLYNLIIK